MEKNITPTGCCPPFDPTPWEGKTFTWENKKFIKDRVFSLFYVPMNFGSVIKRSFRQVEQASAEMLDGMCLSDHTSKWNMDIYLAVDREIPGAENVTLSGKFLSRVYEGPFQNTRQWCDDFSNRARDEGFAVKKWYMWYTTCPKCAKSYGKNYVVIIGQLE